MEERRNRIKGKHGRMKDEKRSGKKRELGKENALELKQCGVCTMMEKGEVCKALSDDRGKEVTLLVFNIAIRILKFYFDSQQWKRSSVVFGTS